MAFGLIAGIVAAVSAAVGAITSASANKANKKLAAQQNDYNLQLQENEFQQNTQQSELEYERQLEMWNLQNEYNSPQAQIERYVSAGLNPNLIYGSGSASAGNSSSAPQYTAARFSAPHAERASVSPVNIDPYQAISNTQAYGIQQAQKDNLMAQTEIATQEASNRRVDNLLKLEELTGRRLTNRQKEELFDDEIQRFHIENRRLSNQADLLANQVNVAYNHWKYLQPEQQQKLLHEIALLRANKDVKEYELQLNKIGISRSDPFWGRLASRIVLSSDDSFSRFIRDLLQ